MRRTLCKSRNEVQSPVSPCSSKLSSLQSLEQPLIDSNILNSFGLLQVLPSDEHFFLIVSTVFQLVAWWSGKLAGNKHCFAVTFPKKRILPFEDQFKFERDFRMVTLRLIDSRQWNTVELGCVIWVGHRSIWWEAQECAEYCLRVLHSFERKASSFVDLWNTTSHISISTLNPQLIQ